ncbi:MAG: hypothetical protein J7L88_03985 [Thermoplasmata archaeon]|nr:hypothetical protein [Thermoplasmata archaeon]
MKQSERLIAKAPIKFLWKAGKNGTWLPPGNWRDGILNLTSERVIIAEGYSWHVIYHDQIITLGDFGRFGSPQNEIPADPLIFAEGMDYYISLLKIPSAIRERLLTQIAITAIATSRSLKVSDRGSRFPAFLEVNSAGVRLYSMKREGLYPLGIIISVNPFHRVPEKRIVKTRDEKGERYLLLSGVPPHLGMLTRAVEWSKVNPLKRMEKLHLGILAELGKSKLNTDKLSKRLDKEPLEVSRAIYELLFLGLIEMAPGKNLYQLSKKGKLAIKSGLIPSGLERKDKIGEGE